MDNATAVDESIDAPSTTDPLFYGLIIFLGGLLGVVTNGFTLLCIFKVPNFKNAFGCLCASHAFADFGILFLFAFWAAPNAFSQSEASISLLGRKLGQLSLFFWFANLYSQLFIAINRCCAITVPVFYRRKFTLHNTKYIIAFIWIAAIIHMPVYFFEGCDFYFDDASYMWMYSASDCGVALGFYMDFLFGCGILACVLALNTITFVRLTLSRKALEDSSKLNGQKNKYMAKQREREIRFFVQACTTAVVFMLMLISFNLLSRYTTTTWSAFASTTLVWEMAHTADGLIMILFNCEFRKMLVKPSLICTASSTRVTVVEASNFQPSIVTRSCN